MPFFFGERIKFDFLFVFFHRPAKNPILIYLKNSDLIISVSYAGIKNNV